MTLQNGILIGDEVRLYSDTAHLLMPEAIVGVIGPKVLESRTWPYAIAMTVIERAVFGTSMYQLASHLNEHVPQNTDALIGCLADWMGAFIREGRGLCRLLVGSYCVQGNTGRLHVIASDDLGFAQPGQAVELSSFTSSGKYSRPYKEATEQGFSRGLMLSLIDCQRIEMMRPDGFSACYGVGGEVVEVVINRAGISKNTVRQWPDALGSKINPL